MTMDNWTQKIQEFVDGIASSVAVVSRGDVDELVIVACNEHFFDMVGGRRTGTHSFPFPLDTIVPSYTRRELRAKIQECFESKVAQELEQAYDLKDGTHWWRLSLKPLLHADVDIPKTDILITGLDITPKMLLTHQLEVSTSRFRSVVNAAYDAIITIDQQHHITLFNRAAEELFGYGQADMIDQPLEVLIPEAHRQHHPEYVHQFARSPVKSRQMDERNRIYGQHRDGSKIPVEIAISKISVDGLVEFTAVIRDITERVHLMDALQEQAATDSLTGLANRREFTEFANQVIRTSKTMSLLVLDVDNFKSVNDTYGHDAGDEALRVLAKVGAQTIQHLDLFARIGGEEFVAVLPDTNIDQAKQMAERLRLIFEKQNFRHNWTNGKAIPFTVSIGVASSLDSDTEVTTILKRADEALYIAKNSGRNRIAFV